MILRDMRDYPYTILGAVDDYGQAVIQGMAISDGAGNVTLRGAADDDGAGNVTAKGVATSDGDGGVTMKNTLRMAVYVASQAVGDSIIYREAQYVGMTKDDVTDRHVIDYNGEKLKVLYVQPKGVFKQVFMAVTR